MPEMSSSSDWLRPPRSSLHGDAGRNARRFAACNSPPRPSNVAHRSTGPKGGPVAPAKPAPRVMLVTFQGSLPQLLDLDGRAGASSCSFAWSACSLGRAPIRASARRPRILQFLQPEARECPDLLVTWIFLSPAPVRSRRTRTAPPRRRPRRRGAARCRHHRRGRGGRRRPPRTP